jgi:hypothetical protein
MASNSRNNWYTKSKSYGCIHNNWLCHYPRPIQIAFDNGSEFFKEMCDNLGVKCSPPTSYNPQGNSVVETIHQVMGNKLREFALEDT